MPVLINEAVKGFEPTDAFAVGASERPGFEARDLAAKDLWQVCFTGYLVSRHVFIDFPHLVDLL